MFQTYRKKFSLFFLSLFKVEKLLLAWTEGIFFKKKEE